MEFHYKLTLDAKYPNNPYKGKTLCSKCYKEVYENAPVPYGFNPTAVNNKNWIVLGEISSLIGIVLLIMGIVKGLMAANSELSQLLGQLLGSQVESKIFWSAFEPFLIGSIILFIIGGVGLMAGSSANNISLATPSPNLATIDPNTISSNSKIICGACGVINEIDALYCKKCGKQLR
jgi:uncharacterized membrane protein